MDTRVTKSVRLVPPDWQDIIDLQESRNLKSLGEAFEVVLRFWRMAERVRKKWRLSPEDTLDRIMAEREKDK